jgi:hypothetical protein
MLEMGTVLVLGAGASIPFGFPSGRALLIRVANGLRHEHDSFARLLMNVGFEWHQLEEFGTSLARSSQPSVDAFLENRRQFIPVGKAAIAAALIPFENPELLMGRGGEQSWYEYLFARLATRKGDLSPGRLAVITFNYDRSLEFFLLESLKHSFGLSDEEAQELAIAVPIYHIYGQLGSLATAASSGRPYVTDVTPDTIQTASNGIRIIGEGVSSNEVLADAAYYLSTARIVTFLGFGFHPENASRLRVDELLATDRPLYGSGYGLQAAERADVQSLFRHKIRLGDALKDILWFIRDNPVLPTVPSQT